MKKRIRLKTHDGSNNYLESYQIGDKDVYRLRTPYNSIRVCEQDGIIEFIDPSGGPMLNVGHVLPCYLENPPTINVIFFVKGLEPGFYLELKFPSE